MVRHEELVFKLQEIGLNRLESEVYITLLRQSPLSGYKIAQILGEGSSNIYKALDILRKKGAIMVEEKPSTRLFTAIPAKEYLTRVEKQIESSLDFLDKNLPQNSSAIKETKVFKLESVDQVLERAEDMIKNAEKQISVDGFPAMVDLIQTHIESVAKKKGNKKVKIVINSYDGKEIKNCVMVKKSAAENALKIWKDNWLSLVVDGEKYLLAVVCADGKTLRHAVWTNSPFLSYVIYSGIASEMMFSVLVDELKNKDLLYLLDKIREQYAVPLMGTSDLFHQLPGFIKIMKTQSEDKSL